MKRKSDSAAECIARRAGSNAALKGKPYNFCPYRSDRLALAWSEGHNAQRAAMLLNRYPRNIATDAPR